MLDKNKLKLLIMQSEFNKDCNTIIDIIAPIVCDKKITKREIDKANQVILNTFGKYNAYKDEDGINKYYPRYTIALFIDYGRTVKIYKHDRSFTVRREDYNEACYMYESNKSIYLDNKMITQERIQQYKYGKKQTPSKAEIIKAYNKYQKIVEQEKLLNDKKDDLPFHYYFNK
jgi:hypothetical protein